MIRSLVLLLLLAGCWIVLSGYFDLFFLSLGAVSVLLSWWIIRRMVRFCSEDWHFPLSPRILIYFAWLVKEIFVSTWSTTRLIWQWKPAITPTMAWVPTPLTSSVGLTLYANSITLTPGTVSVLVHEGRIAVHGLVQENIDALVEGKMVRRIQNAIE